MDWCSEVDSVLPADPAAPSCATSRLARARRTSGTATGVLDLPGAELGW
jgi:hypothetical protein